MILSVLRIAATWLVFSATAALVAGCGGSGHVSSSAQALEFAHAVNLRAGGELPHRGGLCSDDALVLVGPIQAR
jgi:hypothetical protein